MRQPWRGRRSRPTSVYGVSVNYKDGSHSYERWEMQNPKTGNTVVQGKSRYLHAGRSNDRREQHGFDAENNASFSARSTENVLTHAEITRRQQGRLIGHNLIEKEMTSFLDWFEGDKKSDPVLRTACSSLARHHSPAN